MASVWSFVIVVLLAWRGSGCTASADSVPRLPSIWSDNQDGSGQDDPAYHIRSEVQISNYKKTFVLEEWASGVVDQFRLDMIAASGGKRSTCLAYQDTNERFYYEPFQCKLVDDFHSVIDRDLAQKLQPPSDSFVSVGVGALWLYALKSDTRHTPHASECDTEQGNTLGCMESYTAPATSSYPYEVSFYFKAPSLGAESLAFILIHRQTSADEDGKTEILMRIRILEVEKSLRETLRRLPDLFDLPEGYGCKRSDKVDTAFERAPDALSSLPLGAQVLRLDVVAQLPAEKGHDVHEWRSHWASVRLVFGKLTLSQEEQRDYLILETRDLAPDKRLRGRRATLQEVRQVWDLGRVRSAPPASGSESGKSHARRRALIYQLDDRHGKCMNMDESQLEAGACIEFPVTSGDDDDDSAADLVKGLMLDSSLLNELFGSAEGYHQIRDGLSSVKAAFREVVYEQRVDKLEMHNQRGEPIWRGPVSLVRKHLLAPETARRRPGGPWQEDLPAQTTATIHFLTTRQDQLMGKVQVTLNERRTINHATFHEELNVGPCFSPGDNRDQIRVRLNYPLDSESLADRVAGCGHCQTMIREQLLRALYRLSGGRLDPLQVDQIELQLAGADLLVVSFRLTAKPNLLNYRREPNLKFSNTRRALLMSELQSSEASCAQSCAHYNCSAFAYCAGNPMENHLCDMLMVDDDQLLVSSMNTEPAKHCALFRSRDRLDDVDHTRAPEPVELLHLMRESISGATDHQVKGQDNHPLALLVTYCQRSSASEKNAHNFNMLVPVSAELVEGEETESGNLLMRAEYELILENTRLETPEERSSLFPVLATRGLDYDQCRDLCEQIDCKSFSHCQLEYSCQVSQLHDTERIKEHSTTANYCSVFAREWLSKFQGPIQVASPPPAVQIAKALRVDEARDCASRCMDERDFRCRSFYHCQTEGLQAPANCYLSKRHSGVVAPKAGPEPAYQAASSSSAEPETRSAPLCQLYTRSYLAEFDRFYGRSLPEVDLPVAGDDERPRPGSEGFSNLLKWGLNAEACGAACAERPGSCQAFHVCNAGQYEAFRPVGPQCVLLLRAGGSRPSARTNEDQVNSSKSAAEEWLKLDQLLTNENCTSFIVAQQSALRRLKPPSDRLVDPLDEPGEGADEERPNHGAQAVSGADAEEDDDAAYHLVMLVIGLIFGCGLTMVWKRRWPPQTTTD